MVGLGGSGEVVLQWGCGVIWVPLYLILVPFCDIWAISVPLDPIWGPQAQQRRVAELQQELAALGEPPQEGTLDDLPQYHEAVQGLLEARAELQVGLGDVGSWGVGGGGNGGLGTLGMLQWGWRDMGTLGVMGRVLEEREWGEMQRLWEGVGGSWGSCGVPDVGEWGDVMGRPWRRRLQRDMGGSWCQPPVSPPSAAWRSQWQG